MTKSLKKVVVGLLGFLTACCFSFALFSGTTANAQESLTLESFKIYNGAYVRVETPVGIRFETGISKTDKAKLPADARFGTIIIPTAMLNGELTLETPEVLDIDTKVWLSETPSAFGADYEGYYSTLVGKGMSDFEAKDYNGFLTARGYVSYTDADEVTHVIYTPETVERTIAGVADAAVKAGSEEQVVLDIVAAAKELKTATLTYNTNGAAEIAPLTTVVGAILVEPEKPVKDGFVFGGWYKDAACTQEFSFSLLRADTTIYAKWTAQIGFAAGDVNYANEVTLKKAVWNGTETGVTFEYSVKEKGTEKDFAVTETGGGYLLCARAFHGVHGNRNG